MQEFKEIALKAAYGAGAIIRENFYKPKEISYKGRIDLVTNIDKKAEDMIIKIIKKSYPTHNILTEERQLSQDPNQEFRWIIDPLDGTTNYVHGFPFVAVSIALHRNGVPQLGIVYNPILEELFYAEKGSKSLKNGSPIAVSSNRDIERAFLATGFPYNMEDDKRNNLVNFINVIRRCRGIRRAGSAAIDLCYVASGIFDGFWELGLSPWDTAAGEFIVRQAGGMVTKIDGSPFSIFDKEIVATNGEIHEILLNLLQKKSTK
jgi:myo-inositol-1(or 4)-monophosphatase